MRALPILLPLLLGAAAATGFAPLDWWAVTLVAFAAFRVVPIGASGDDRQLAARAALCCSIGYLFGTAYVLPWYDSLAWALIPLVAASVLDELLLLHTTNRGSLTRSLFGRDWEGYFDWTHLGVDRVSVESLTLELPRRGWTIEHLHTHLVWTVCADPTHATLREWYAADARFQGAPAHIEKEPLRR